MTYLFHPCLRLCRYGLLKDHQSLALFVILLLLPGLVTAAHTHSGVEQPIGPVAQSAQQPAVANNAAKNEQDARSLEPGKPIERELAGGQSHTYQITLAEGQFLNVIVEQRGIDVVVWLLGPDGKQIAEFDSEIRNQGQETVTQVAEAPGGYRLNVQAKQKEAPAGRYEIRVMELRAATEQDRALQEARDLNTEVRRLYRAGKYDEARPLADRVLALRERALGPEHLEVAAALNNLGLLYGIKGDYALAEPLYQRSLTIREKALEPEHPSVASALNNLANLYWIKGDYPRAESLYQRALTIQEKALGPQHPGVANSLNTLANIYFGKGDYARAEMLYQRALTIHESVLGPEHPTTAGTVYNLAELHRLKGDYARAEPLHQRALAIWEKSLGPAHPEVGRSLNNLAELHRLKGDYAKAESLYQRARDILEKSFGAEHPELAAALNSLALLYWTKGDYAKAEPLYQRALEIRGKALRPEHPDVAQSLENLAVLYHVKSEYAKAEPLHQRTLAIREKALPAGHPSVAAALNNLALLYAAKGDSARAVTFQLRANAISERNLALNLATGSERQKLAYLATLSAQADQTISLHVYTATNDPMARNLAAAAILQRKGRALDAMTDSFSALRRRFNAQDRSLLDDLSAARAQLATLMFRGPGATNPGQYQTETKRLRERIEHLEATISTRSAEFRAQSPAGRVGGRASCASTGRDARRVLLLPSLRRQER